LSPKSKEISHGNPFSIVQLQLKSQLRQQQIFLAVPDCTLYSFSKKEKCLTRKWENTEEYNIMPPEPKCYKS
ncbi:MAG: hypothetical protein WAL94_09770, partial [Bacteroidales bacterium]